MLQTFGHICAPFVSLVIYTIGGKYFCEGIGKKLSLLGIAEKVI